MKIWIIWIAFFVCFFESSHQKCTEEFVVQFVQKHNELRARHGVEPLVHSKPISYWAQDWADHLVESESFEYREANHYGENIFFYLTPNEPNQVPSIPPVDAPLIVEEWYEEIEEYHWWGEEPPPPPPPLLPQVPQLREEVFQEWSHFTQVVWKESRHIGVGCGEAGGRFVVVADYDPPGNVPGQYGVDVFPVQENYLYEY